MGCDDGAVFELYCRRGVTSLLQTFLGSRGGATIVGSDFGLIEEHLNFADFSLVACATCQFVGSVVVASDDFVFRSLAAYFVVANAEAYHVDAHVGRRLVRVGAIDAFEQGVEHREDFDVAIIVDGCFAVSLKMEWVDHVDVVEVGCGSLVGYVDRMFEREVPNRECLKLSVSGSYAMFVFVVELAQAYSHFAATRTRSGNDN